MSLRLVLTVLSVGLLLLACWTVVGHQQRTYSLNASEDLKLVAGYQTNEVIGSLPKGTVVRVEACDDRKSSIEPLVRSEDGRLASVAANGAFTISVRHTGLLSWPRFDGCPSLTSMDR